MRRLALASALLLGLAGCSLTLDPDSVPPPVAQCVPTGCAGHACGYVDCGTTCQPGSGCTSTHSVQGRLTPAAGNAAASGGHAVSRGTLAHGAANQAAPSGHSISQGTLSP
jgi:hypothetical protein